MAARIDDGCVEFSDRIGPADPHPVWKPGEAGIVDPEYGHGVESPALGTSDGVDLEQRGGPGDAGHPADSHQLDVAHRLDLVEALHIRLGDP